MDRKHGTHQVISACRRLRVSHHRHRRRVSRLRRSQKTSCERVCCSQKTNCVKECYSQKRSYVKECCLSVS